MRAIGKIQLAWPPLVQSRPVWIDDPHFNVAYHVRHTALPAPGSDEQLTNLAARVFSQQLDRSKPLWEMWLVDRLGESGHLAVLHGRDVLYVSTMRTSRKARNVAANSAVAVCVSSAFVSIYRPWPVENEFFSAT